MDDKLQLALNVCVRFPGKLGHCVKHKQKQFYEVLLSPWSNFPYPVMCLTKWLFSPHPCLPFVDASFLNQITILSMLLPMNLLMNLCMTIVCCTANSANKYFQGNQTSDSIDRVTSLIVRSACGPGTEGVFQNAVRH